MKRKKNNDILDIALVVLIAVFGLILVDRFL